MISLKVFLLSSAMLLMMFRRTDAAAGDLADACKVDGTCTDTTNHVCDPEANQCRVIADGAKTDCSSADANCPTNAVCSTTTCACSSGYTQTGGLCTVIGETCTADSDCSSKVPNSMCQINSPCTKGICACSTGYSGTVCTTLSYNVACSSANDHCGTGLTCTSSKCACTSDSWNSDVSACTAKKAFGGACPTDLATDCYTTLNGACTSNICTCASGYIQDTATSGSQSCRRPLASESTCTSGNCAKVVHSYISGSETSQATPTCTSGTCGCGSGETMISGKLGSDVCYSFCLTDLGSGTTALANGATCTHHNQCSGNACLQCPGDAGHICYTATCGGAEAVNAVLMPLLLTVAGVKFLF